MNRFKKDFPIFQNRKRRSLVYLDNGATTQRANSVLRAMLAYYTEYNANIHRGLHDLSQQATQACEDVRVKVQRLIGARLPAEIVFTSGTTMGINLIAMTWGQKYLKSGDEILLSIMEHHANIVPWQELAKRRRLKISFIPLAANGELDYRWLKIHATKKTKLISVTHVSNVLGAINDLAAISAVARKVGARLLIDAAQSIAHEVIDVKKHGIDFLVFSGHKMYGPTGIGVLYINNEIAQNLPPFFTGGDMIMEVTTSGATYQDPPHRFEAGTPHIAGIIGLGAAVDYLLRHGIRKLKLQEAMLTAYAYARLKRIPGLTIYGPKQRSGILAFNLAGVHAHDVADILNRRHIAIRSGNHCAMPLHRYLGVVASARATLACYNTTDDIDTLIAGISEVKKIFHV